MAVLEWIGVATFVLTIVVLGLMSRAPKVRPPDDLRRAGDHSAADQAEEARQGITRFWGLK
jgi:hypothetical protein